MSTLNVLRKRLDSLHVMMAIMLVLAVLNLSLAAVTLLGL